MAEPGVDAPIISYLSLDPPAPLPETSPDKYTATKVQNRLEFAQRLKTRDITPRSEIFLQLYEDAAESALCETANDDEKLSSYKRLYRYDKFIEANSFLCKERTEQQKMLEEKLLKLKRLEYYLRYGDYLAGELTALKDVANRLKTDQHEQLHQYWTIIHKKILVERTHWEDVSKKSTSRDIPTLMAVWAAAKAVDVPEDRVLWLIKRYAERNLLAHSTIAELLSTGRWSQLANALYHDVNDLNKMIPPGMEGDIENMTIVIGTIRKKYFVIDEGDEDDPDTWRANDEAARHRVELRKKSAAKDEKKAELVEIMTKKANEAAQLREERKGLLEKAILVKRKASNPFPLGEKLLAKKTKQMEKVVGIQRTIAQKEGELDNVYKLRDRAVEALGDLRITKDETKDV